MKQCRIALALLAVLMAKDVWAQEHWPDPELDILVMLEASDAAPVSGGIDPPYRKRKRYAMPLDTQLLAAEITEEYGLLEIGRWPMRSLSVICIVFRVTEAGKRDELVGRLQVDPRIDSAQRLQRFDTRTAAFPDYDDPYIGLQRSLAVMGVPAAHRYSRGRGIRIAVVDSAADVQHEDLKGRITAARDFTDHHNPGEPEHGTAVASVIGASANNARGIVGVAPEAEIELYVACWTEGEQDRAVCDSFTLAKALDALATGTADIVNLSLSGPHDPLLERLLDEIEQSGAIIVAARPEPGAEDSPFPANLDGIISVTSGDEVGKATPVSLRTIARDLYAPAERIVVALPSDNYGFRSGNSLAAAHASGVTALLLSVSPELESETVLDYLRESQQGSRSGTRSINACAALQLAEPSRICP
jgi:subtilisin family serine protease